MRLKHKRMRRIRPSTDEWVSFITKLLGILAVIFVVWSQNNLLLNKEYIYEVPNLSSEMTGYRIIHISDLCNTNINVYSSVRAEKPDIILISGGYIDKKGNTDKSVEIVNSLCSIAPVYYIYNSEDKKYNLQDMLSSTEATDITDKQIEIKDNVDIVGLSLCNINDDKEIKRRIYEIAGKDADKTHIAIVDSTDNIESVSNTNIDILFTGDCNNKTEYKRGASAVNKTQLFISAGIGNSKDSPKFRVFRYPELQTVVLSDGTITKKPWLEKMLDKLFNSNISTVFENTKLKEYREIYD